MHGEGFFQEGPTELALAQHARGFGFPLAPLAVARARPRRRQQLFSGGGGPDHGAREDGARVPADAPGARLTQDGSLVFSLSPQPPVGILPPPLPPSRTLSSRRLLF